MLIFDGDIKSNVTTSYKPLIRIPKEGLRVQFWYRKAIPGHPFNVAMNHYDKDGKWMSGKNNDMTSSGNGRWQEFDVTVTEFPSEARFVRIMARATTWKDSGEDVGLVWFDDISVRNPKTKEEYIKHGEKFWWYICTGPKAPYCTLFIDHPGTELRVWLWQTWQRNIEGVLVWQTNYWTSNTAYPDQPVLAGPVDSIRWEMLRDGSTQ